MNTISMDELETNPSEYLARAADEEMLVTRNGKPAAVIIGFKDEDDWFDYHLENDERFLDRIEDSRRQAREGKTCRLEDLPD